MMSRSQQQRLGALIAVHEGRVPYDHLLADLNVSGFVLTKTVVSEDDPSDSKSVIVLTERGIREHDRLMTIAGFMVAKTT